MQYSATCVFCSVCDLQAGLEATDKLFTLQDYLLTLIKNHKLHLTDFLSVNTFVFTKALWNLRNNLMHVFFFESTRAWIRQITNCKMYYFFRLNQHLIY